MSVRTFPSPDEREWAQEALVHLREQYHELSLEDRLTVRRTLREMAKRLDDDLRIPSAFRALRKALAKEDEQ
jgi:hypothetical protein